ncbi:MAG: hypothetical protein ACRDBM_06330 [Sporomusa sp.]
MCVAFPWKNQLLVLGLLAIIVGMVIKGASPIALINSAAFIIIIVGTAASLFNAFH